jgi:hypothetical protein
VLERDGNTYSIRSNLPNATVFVTTAQHVEVRAFWFVGLSVLTIPKSTQEWSPENASGSRFSKRSPGSTSGSHDTQSGLLLTATIVSIKVINQNFFFSLPDAINGSKVCCEYVLRDELKFTASKVVLRHGGTSHDLWVFEDPKAVASAAAS